MLYTNTNLPKELTSGWELGEPPSPETIRQGTVRMEDHPDYEAAIKKALDAGFEIRVSGEASVEWTELYDLNQNFVRLEKLLNVAAGMRYIDLEHELGHIEQLSRFGDKVPPLAKKVEVGDGHRRDADVLAGIMKTKHIAILEYHNRLVEFVRLYERNVNVQILNSHADDRYGVEESYIYYQKKGVNWGKSTTGIAFIEKYFPELAELERKYKEARKQIKETSDEKAK